MPAIEQAAEHVELSWHSSVFSTACALSIRVDREHPPARGSHGRPGCSCAGARMSNCRPGSSAPASALSRPSSTPNHSWPARGRKLGRAADTQQASPTSPHLSPCVNCQRVRSPRREIATDKQPPQLPAGVGRGTSTRSRRRSKASVGPESSPTAVAGSRPATKLAIEAW
jgi:hypothetical protein